MLLKRGVLGDDPQIGYLKVICGLSAASERDTICISTLTAVRNEANDHVSISCRTQSTGGARDTVSELGRAKHYLPTCRGAEGL